MMAHLLGPSFLLSSLTANIAGRGGEEMFLHSDQGYISFPTEKAVVASRVATNPDVVAEAAPDAAPVTVEREEARILPRRRARVQVPAEPPAPVLPPMPRLVKATAS